MINKSRQEQKDKEESEFGSIEVGDAKNKRRSQSSDDATRAANEEEKSNRLTTEPGHVESREVKLYTNYFKIVNDPNLVISQLNIAIEPELNEAGEMKNWLLKKLVRQITPELKKLIPYWVRLGQAIYAPKNLQALDIPAYETEVDDQKYKITVEWHS